MQPIAENVKEVGCTSSIQDVRQSMPQLKANDIIEESKQANEDSNSPGIVHNKNVVGSISKEEVLHRYKTHEFIKNMGTLMGGHSAGQGKNNESQCSSKVAAHLADIHWTQSIELEATVSQCTYYEIIRVKVNGKNARLRKIKKVMFPSEESMSQYRSMLGELVKLEHPNLVQVFDWREDDYNFYVVYEHLEGGPVF